MQLIFTDEVVAKYNGLFAFLFRVNRVQYALGKAWAEQMQHQKTLRKGNSKMAVASRMMNLRANMSFLVDNIQQYLKVKILMPTWLPWPRQHALSLQGSVLPVLACFWPVIYGVENVSVWGRAPPHKPHPPV